jgi:hypothetical protein
LYSSVDSDYSNPPDTPSPVSPDQQNEAYAPLQVRRSFAGSDTLSNDPAAGQLTHVRIADYMRKTRNQKTAKNHSNRPERTEPRVPVPVEIVAGPVPSHAHEVLQQKKGEEIVEQAPAQKGSPKKETPKKEPAHRTSVSRRSEASCASMASKHSIFSTPGRDEMERKKPIAEEDEGPFAKATNMKDLEQRRRKVSKAEDDEGSGKEKRMCGTKCLVM